MKINISYTVLDIIEVPDDWNYERIQQRCEENWVELLNSLNEIGCVPNYNDMEWFSRKE